MSVSALTSKERAFELLEQYLLEKENSQTIYNENALFIFKIEGTNIHISNAVVDKNQRRKGFGKEMLNYLMEVARVNNCETITCNVDQNQSGADLSLKSVIKSGFQIIPPNSKAHDTRLPLTVIQFYKEVKNG